MVFCNTEKGVYYNAYVVSHNPYFNRWFSAMSDSIAVYDTDILVTILILIDGFLQYGVMVRITSWNTSHNPYFNRWFSAICARPIETYNERESQSLF